MVKEFSNREIIKRSKRLQDKCKYNLIKTQERDKNVKRNKFNEQDRSLEVTVAAKVEAKPTKHKNKMPLKVKNVLCENKSKELPKTRKRRENIEEIDYKEEDAQFSCILCDKAFKYFSALSAHSLTHTNKKPFKCEHCQSEFSQKSHLTRHSFSHKKRKPFECDICQKKFSVKYSMVVHLRTHNGQKLYSCEKCGKEFSQKSHLNTHSKSHLAKSITCGICSKLFTLTHHLNSHVKSIHKLKYASLLQ